MGVEVAAMAFIAVAGTAISYSQSKSAQRDAKSSYAAQMASSAEMARHEASAVWESAKAQAGAIEAQAAKERALFYKEAESARAIAFNNINLMREEAQESVRRLRLDQEQMESRGRAAAAASGVRMEGSVDIAMKSFEDENRNQLNWLDKSQKSAINNANFEANQMYDMYRAKGDTAFEVSKIAAGSIMKQAGIQSSLLHKQASSYSAQSSQIGYDSAARRATIQGVINSGRTNEEHGR